MVWDIIISIIGVIGTWIGVYLAYKAIKKENTKMAKNIQDSFNKSNIQIGRFNKNAQ